MKTLILGILILSHLTALVAEETKLSRVEIETLIRQQLTSWETMDVEEFKSTLHPDVVFAYPGKRLNFDDALGVFLMWKEEFEDTKVYIHRILIEDQFFSIEYQFSTTKKSSGKRMASGTVTVGVVEDGKIKIWKEYLDGRVSRMQEKDELPLDEGKEPFPWPQ